MTEIRAERKSVLDYLSKNRFLIPMYQRPYVWDIEKCEELWNDIVDFFSEEKNIKDKEEYFLGSAVMYEDNGKQNIIDGQQRTTSLSLLIKALYNKASRDKSEDTQKLVSSLESCLWEIDDISGKANQKELHLKSEVATENDNEKLEQILNNTYELPDDFDLDKAIKRVKTNYEKNYLFFIQKSDEFAKNNPTQWEKLCVFILKSCILLPIECEGKNETIRQENALRIFNTLNNRGEPLGDTDIFKGIIFTSKKSAGERKDFAERWKELENETDINFIFRNYKHIIRARNKIKSGETGLRPFFTKEYKEVLEDKNLMEELENLTHFWESDKNWTLKFLQFDEILDLLPNEYWKYLLSTYYMYCKDKNKNFFEEKSLENFFRKTITHFLVKLINKPTIAEIKPLVFNAYVSLYEKDELDFQTNTKEILAKESLFKEQFFNAKSITSSLLSLYMYIKYPEQEIIYGEIEHIFPQTTKWRKTYTGWDKEEAKPFIDSIGNKIWLEKKLNIKASNGYFDEKKEKYKESRFLEVKALSEYPKNDWLKEDIIQRGNEIYETLRKFFEENL